MNLKFKSLAAVSLAAGPVCANGAFADMVKTA